MQTYIISITTPSSIEIQDNSSWAIPMLAN